MSKIYMTSEFTTSRPVAYAVELKRYDNPAETWRFQIYGMFGQFHVDGLFADNCYEKPYEDAPAYGEIHRTQCGIEKADTEREDLTNSGFVAYTVEQMREKDPDLLFYATYNVLPMEWHGGMVTDEREITERVTIWIKEN